MCEGCKHLRTNWKGWLSLPKMRETKPAGPWIDLSHCLTEELSRISLLPPPSFRQIANMPESAANVTEIKMVTHVGTHLDAPCHFIPDGPSAEGVPLERLYGPGVIWRIDVPAFAEISVEDLENATPKMQPGDIVLISTGWAKHVNTEYYEDHPALSVEAAEWLVAKQAKLVGVDFSTPDLTVHKRPDDFQWPVHQVLLSQGVLIAEHLTNLEELENKAAEIMLLGLNIHGSDGMPARVVARAIH